MRTRAIKASIGPSGEGWIGRTPRGDLVVTASTRERCLALLRERLDPDVALTVEVTPRLVGVAEAAAILGWDKRRVITYVDRGSFPEPLARLASGRVWRREDVEAFRRRRERTTSGKRVSGRRRSPRSEGGSAR